MSGSFSTLAARLGLLALLVAAGCGGPRTTATEEVREWASGPVRWLLQPEERRLVDRVRTRAQLVALRAAFWSRRDPQGRATGPGSFQELFDERVRAADTLYDTGAVRGSLTDRGHALVVLGFPARIERRLREVVAWEPGMRPGEQRRRSVPSEEWVYARGELLPAQADLAPIRVVFLLEKDGGRLIRGERALAAASAALVRGE